MANLEHLRILNKGAEVWNEWRRENPNISPDLSRIKLFKKNLDTINFSRTTLSGALFQVTDFSGADFGGAVLDLTTFEFSNLINASFAGANLERAIFFGCSLQNVNFTDAYCTVVNFTNTNLHSANFKNTNFGNTIFGKVDLSNATGLGTCFHFSPSMIDHHTLISSGKLPLGFLRGCGLPDTLIEFLPSLLNDPIKFYASFISYSSKDQRFADRLYADLQNKGVRCWLTTEDLKIGNKIRPSIDEAIRLHEKLLLILSKHSVASDWVEQEVETALERERKEKRLILFPIRLDDTVMKIEGGWPALIRNTRNIGDFRKWKQHDSYQKVFNRLLRDLNAEEISKQ